jgi:hypothetical protein
MTMDTLSEASFLNAVEALRANNAKNLAEYGRVVTLTPVEVRTINRGPQALRDATARVLRRWRRQRRDA